MYYSVDRIVLKISHTLVLADVNEQKQHSETQSFSVLKKDESDYLQIK